MASGRASGATILWARMPQLWKQKTGFNAVRAGERAKYSRWRSQDEAHARSIDPPNAVSDPSIHADRCDVSWAKGSPVYPEGMLDTALPPLG